MVGVLFLCTGNSARSIMAEALLNSPAISQGRFRAYSAGSHPKGRVHPLALDTLAAHGLPAEGYRSKSWDEFAAPGAPGIDFVFTVCDSAAAEPCPIWPGHPANAHWGIPDPAESTGTDDDRRRAFEEAFLRLRHRIQQFSTLPLERLTPAAVQEHLERIGRDS